MSGRKQGLVESQLSSTDVHVDEVRTKVEKVLSLHSQPSPYKVPPGYFPEGTVRKLTTKNQLGYNSQLVQNLSC